MASTSSSHQQNAFSAIEPPKKRRKIEESSRVFDVFINHRGPDVKQILASPIYNSLKALGISAFLDSEEKELGNSFTSIIETAIRSASLHIAIFSKGYAQSAWCLAELDLMLQTNAKIIPVFYQVEPCELRYIEKGVYAEAFRQHQEKGRYLHKLEEWKEALQKVSYTAGDVVNPDSIDCKNIVSAVEKELKMKKHLYVAKYPVGLHKLVGDFERRCLGDLVHDFESNFRMKKAAKGKANVVGIFGMGGVGKTTLSKELFNQKRSKYTRASFLFDVREACATGKLPSLQSKLLKDIFGEDQIFHSSEEGTNCLRDFMERSSSLSFLIVLDDIDHVEQLDALLVGDVLKKSNNNLVIITTRNVGVLVSTGIDICYHLKGLEGEAGRELFCWHAFDQPLPCSGFEDLVQEFVKMCGGLPLSLIVLGRHVVHRPKKYWQDALEKVRKALPGDVKKSLKISFDALDNEEKQIFMDIACFFIDMSITKAMSIWKGSGWRGQHALETLKEKCLIEEVDVSYVNRLVGKWETSPERFVLRMHDHLRDLGREMANELSHPPRLWRPQDLKYLESKRFRNILAETKGRCFHSIVDASMGCRITYFLGEPEDGSDTSLLWLQLEYLSDCPVDLNSDIYSGIPPWIPLQYLQCLRISNGCLKKLWQSDVQAPFHLKELQIRDTYLEEFPKFLGKLNNMEKLILHATHIQTDIWSCLEPLRMNLRSLMITGLSLSGDLANDDTTKGTTFNSLYVYHFRRLWEGEVSLNAEGTVIMRDIENLEIESCRLVTKILINGNCCQRLQSLKICEMENLIEVNLARIKTLNRLEVTGCEKFKRLLATPDLCKLVDLKISICVELEELGLAHLSCLEKITIENCNHLKSVSGISDLKKLVELQISGCQMFEFERLCLSGMKHLERIAVDRYVKIKYFELDSCENLRTVMFNCKNIVKLSIRYCAELEILPDLIGPSCLKRIVIDGCGNLKYLRLDALENLRQLEINQCPALEELPSLARLSCLQNIKILFCEKLQRIILPTTLLPVWEESCRDLQRIEGIAYLTKLTNLEINQCPALEELPSLARLSCLENIEILFCEKLQRIILPTTLLTVWVKSCRDLQRIEGIADLTKLTDLEINQCPALEELPSLARLSCLEIIKIVFCEKLQRIILPTTLLTVWVESCKDLQRIEGIADLTKLTNLVIIQCPALEELPSLARLSCLEEIVIASCEKLQDIAGVEELQLLEFLGLGCYNNAVIRNCIHKLECDPSLGMFMIGGAVHGADSILNQNMLCDANIGVDGVIEIGTHETQCVWSELSAIIECYVVTRDTSEEDKDTDISEEDIDTDISEEDISEEHIDTDISEEDIDTDISEEHIDTDISEEDISEEDIDTDISEEDISDLPFNKVCEGEWIITIMLCEEDWRNPFKDVLRRDRIMKGFRVEMKKGEQWKSVGVLRTIVDRLHHI